MNNSLVDEIIECLKSYEDYIRDDVVHDLVNKVLKNVSFDEVELTWDGRFIGDLESFATDYFSEIIEVVCNILEDFREE